MERAAGVDAYCWLNETEDKKRATGQEKGMKNSQLAESFFLNFAQRPPRICLVSQLHNFWPCPTAQHTTQAFVCTPHYIIRFRGSSAKRREYEKTRYKIGERRATLGHMEDK